MIRIRNVIRYIVVIALNVFVMMALHSYVNFLLLIGLVLFPLYSICGVRRVAGRLRIALRLPQEDMIRGETLMAYVEADNPTWFPLVNATLFLHVENAFYREEGAHRLNIPIRAHGRTQIAYPIVMEACGCLQMDVTKLECLDLLGVYRIDLPMSVHADCLVLPNGEKRDAQAGALYQKGVAEAMESREKGYDFSDISGIREYIPGDKLQNIHWKLSTKKDELMVKERVSVSAMQLHVLVELARDDQQCTEGILELADSVTKAFVRQNLPFTVHYFSVRHNAMQEQYIGNEMERRQWMEMMLYDFCYTDGRKARELFARGYPSVGRCLYIGLRSQAGKSEDCLVGAHGAAAVLEEI